MSVPPLRLSTNFDSYISGEVIIHPSAVIAPGVILQAAPNSKIIIGSGVCIGMGSILKVHQGTLEVESGANLGAGFLMIGEGKIGTNACIGSATTVYNCSVQAGQVIAPGSVLGDKSRQIAEFVTSTEEIKSPELSARETHSNQEVTENISATPTLEAIDTSAPQNSSNPVESPPAISNNQDSQEPTTESSVSFGSHIYGQGSIQQLLITLFPHRQALNQPISDDQSE